MSNIIKVALIGLGNIGAKHIKALLATPNVDIVAVCDIKSENYIALGLSQNITFYKNYTQLLSCSDADIICITTPHGLHYKMSIDSLNAGKHVIVEKPMALNKSDCEKMIEVANKANKKLFVVKQNRFNDPILLINIALQENRLGKIYGIQANVLWNRRNEYYTNSDWRGQFVEEGGALYTQVDHFLDILIWWFGDLEDSKTIIETMHHNIEIEDIGVAALKFSSGVVGSLLWTTCVYNKNYEGSITIIGEKGTIKIGGEYLNKIVFWDVESYPMPVGYRYNNGINYINKDITSTNHYKMINEIIKHFTSERNGIVEGAEGKKTIEAIEMIYAGTKK